MLDTMETAIDTPIVTLEDMQVSDTASTHTVTHCTDIEPIHIRKNCLSKQLRTEHLNGRKQSVTTDLR